MLDLLQQMALVDMLLINWDSLLMRLAPMSPALAAQFAALGLKLREAANPDSIARIVDDLLDLTEDTAAETYARSLVTRAGLDQEKTREIGLTQPGSDGALADIAQSSAAQTAQTFAAVLSQTSSLPVGVLSAPVFFATNREPGAESKIFTGEVSTTLTLGLAQVSVPVAAHRLGNLERPKWWNLYTADEQKFFLLNSVSRLSGSDFGTELGKATQASGSQELLIFLHGFNVTFEEAALRAAQFAYDSGFQGIVVLFSWPSLGKVSCYAADEDRAGASGEKLAAFLRSLEAGAWKRVHLLAHSMGNRVLLSALADNARASLPFGQLVFAAADVYVPVFNEKFPKLQLAGRLPATSYASRGDRALLLSSLLHAGSRVGIVQGTPYVTENMETIDASWVDKGLLGHGYWSDQRALISDLRSVLQNGLSPKDRGLSQTGKFWSFPR